MKYKEMELDLTHDRKSKPRVGVDMHTVDGIHQGIRTHVLGLFSRVVEQGPDFQFIFFLDDPEKLRAHSSFRRENVEIVRMRHSNPPLRLLAQLPSMARKLRLDLLHTQFIAPPYCSCPTAVTIHDTLFESHPQFFSKIFVLRCKILVRHSVRKSSLVCSVSDFSRGEIERLYRIKRENIVTTANGTDLTRFFPRYEETDLIAKLGLTPKSYFLTVGRLEPRKNHVGLLKAYCNLERPRPKLVIVGQKDFGYTQIFAFIREHALEDDVFILENITDKSLPTIYKNALAFIFPSWAEGFGMPVLEAMASGIPVVTSDSTALAEVALGAALLVRPDDSESIAQAMESVIANGKMREGLVERGLARAQEFSWEASASRLLTSYRKLFSMSEPSWLDRSYE
jgi:glycosyltransferase involved in cell wall biosynthesis